MSRQAGLVVSFSAGVGGKNHRLAGVNHQCALQIPGELCAVGNYRCAVLCRAMSCLFRDRRVLLHSLEPSEYYSQ